MQSKLSVYTKFYNCRR